ncbi:MAG: alpha/beta hydrolase [Azonexus sp.]|jgi:pimeloyl-ACP methyl ester carboxylesterase|nr:alpha/beta hydrolase [Azonexus sp.]
MTDRIQLSRSEYLDLPGARIHVRHWGKPDAPTLFMLHGWMDCSITFQFLVDAFVHQWHVIAPDWRGFGLSQWQNRPYMFIDYSVDLAALLDQYSPDTPVRLLGHSMGGNVAAVFSGLFPERIARLALLENFGAPAYPRDGLRDRLAHWIRETRQGPPPLRTYANLESYAERLRHGNHRLTPERAHFLAQHFSRRDEQGLITAAADPWHRAASPRLLNVDDFRGLWRHIEAPTLFVAGQESTFFRRFDSDPKSYADHRASFRRLSEVVLSEAGHNVQHDQPEQLASILEAFFLGG